LALCELLSKDAEVRRAYHFVPGYLDTPMLHENHWVLKEHGDPRFPELVRQSLPSLYRAIFRETSNDSFRVATRALGLADPRLPAVFDRYRTRRRMAADSPQGIIAPEQLASYVADLVLEASALESGIFEIIAPHGRLSIAHRPF
jgi:hypothetical protein